MITLSTSGNSVIFTFQDNQHYLQNGTIEVPKNSLSLVTDDSNMATFKKSASNDIFISALYSELGMTKAELETWFEENATTNYGGGGGGGGDVTSAQVQTMIDASISGKADAVSAVCSAEYVESSTTIDFKNIDGTVISSIDASDFIVDGMIENVSIETISGVSYLVIDFNTASGKEDIQIPLTDIFDPSNYYTKAEADSAISAATDDMATQTWVGNQGYITGVDLSDYATLQDVDEAVSGKADTSAVTAVNNVLTAHTADTTIHVTSSDKSTWSGKQDALVSGTNIKTINNQSLLGSGNITISGGSGSGTAAVEVTQAEYDALVSGGTVDPTVFYIITDAPAIEASGFVQTSAITSAVTSASTDSQIPTAKAVFDAIPTVTNTITSGSTDVITSGGVYAQLDGLKLQKVTQAEYDALVSGGTVDSSTVYIIVN